MVVHKRTMNILQAHDSIGRRALYKYCIFLTRNQSISVLLFFCCSTAVVHITTAVWPQQAERSKVPGTKYFEFILILRTIDWLVVLQVRSKCIKSCYDDATLWPRCAWIINKIVRKACGFKNPHYYLWFDNSIQEAFGHMTLFTEL